MPTQSCTTLTKQELALLRLLKALQIDERPEPAVTRRTIASLRQQYPELFDRYASEHPGWEKNEDELREWVASRFWMGHRRRRTIPCYPVPGYILRAETFALNEHTEEGQRRFFSGLGDRECLRKTLTKLVLCGLVSRAKVTRIHFVEFQRWDGEIIEVRPDMMGKFAAFQVWVGNLHLHRCPIRTARLSHAGWAYSLEAEAFHVLEGRGGEESNAEESPVAPWSRPPDTIRTGEIVSERRFRKPRPNGQGYKNPAESTIQRWVKASKRRGQPVHIEHDTATGENYYPKAWVHDCFRRWNPRGT